MEWVSDSDWLGRSDSAYIFTFIAVVVIDVIVFIFRMKKITINYKLERINKRK